jgi:hypothetical protein
MKPTDEHSCCGAWRFLAFVYGVAMPLTTPTVSLESSMESLGVTPLVFWVGAAFSIPLSIAFSYFVVQTLPADPGFTRWSVRLFVEVTPSYAVGIFVHVTFSLLGVFAPNSIGYLSLHACTALAFGFGGRLAVRCNSVAPVKEGLSAGKEGSC